MKICPLLFYYFITGVAVAQDFKNALITHSSAPSSMVIASDVETIYSQILTTGLYAPANNDIPGISNPAKAYRIFLDNYSAASLLFSKAYLIDAYDNVTLNKSFNYVVTEIKFDGSGYVICGNIRVKMPSLVFNDAFIMKVDFLGNYMWFKRYPIPGSISTSFNSIVPVINGSVLGGYIACGYHLDASGVKRALLVKTDTMGNITAPSVRLLQWPVGTRHPHSEFSKIIHYQNDEYTLTGMCSVLKDSCKQNTQSNILFTMYNANTNIIHSKEIGTQPFSYHDLQSDEGVSLVKCDTGVIILSKFYKNSSLPCTQTRDVWTNLIHVNPVTPNPTSWQLLKSLKFNINTSSALDNPKDLLYVSGSGSKEVWVYADYSASKGFINKISINNGTSMIVPKIMNNNPGGIAMSGKTINYNSLGNVIGLSELQQSAYSIFELSNSTLSGCQSDSGFVNIVKDTLKWNYLFHDTINLYTTLFKHKSFSINAADSVICDTVSGKLRIMPDKKRLTLLARIYPNPAEEEATLELNVEQTDKYSIHLYDLAGKLIKTIRKHQILEQGYHHIPMPLHSVGAGIYSCIIQNGREQILLKIVKN